MTDPSGVTSFGIPFVSSVTEADDRIWAQTYSCWRPVILRTHHMSFCFLPRTLPIPPENTWPDSTGSGKSTAQKCREDNAPRGDPQPTGARGWLVTVPVSGPARDNFQCYSQENSMLLLVAVTLLTYLTVVFPPFLPQSFVLLPGNTSHANCLHASPGFRLCFSDNHLYGWRCFPFTINKVFGKWEVHNPL